MLQLGPIKSLAKQTGIDSIKNSKPKKQNNRRRVRKSPPRALRLETIDDQTGLRMNTETCANAPDTVVVISGSDNQDITGRLTRSPGYLSPPTTPTAKTLPPPPNATVVVCVLAGTGRADLWIRNNRGQTPLDLCPADQPLRRALIKCCDAAARARSLQLPISKTETDSAPTTVVQQQPSQQLKLETNNTTVSNNTIKIPHRLLTTDDSESSKECSKTLTTQNYFEHVNKQTNCVNNGLSTSDCSPLLVVPSQNNDIFSTVMTMTTASNSLGNIDEITAMVASTDLGTWDVSGNINQNDCNDNNDLNPDHGDNKTKCGRKSGSSITDNSDRFV